MSSRPKHGKIGYSNRKVIIVLAGGLLSDGHLTIHVKQRLKKAVEISFEDTLFICSSIFTLNKPQVVNNGFVKSEANEMASYIKKLSPSSDVLLENASFDTIGSALFTRMCFDFLLKGCDVIVVTSDFHIKRASVIFKKVFGLRPFLGLKSLEFVSSESDLKSVFRINHEKNAIKNFDQTSRHWLDIDDAKLWLFTKHDNYEKFKSSSNLKTKIIIEMGY